MAEFNGTGRGGFLGAADTQQRITEIGAARNPGSRGLWLQNYYTSRKRKSSAPPIDPGLKQLVDYAIGELMRKLRYENPGINVRLPSHINPPFRSVQFTFQRVSVALTGTTQRIITVLFGGQSEVPDGLQGVISSIECTNQSQDTDGAQTIDIRFTMSVNGNVVPGFLRQATGRLYFEQFLDIAGSENDGFIIQSPVVATPIKLQPGDVVQIALEDLIGVDNPDVFVRIAGWLYPIEVEADGIVGTMADLGGQVPTRGVV